MRSINLIFSSICYILVVSSIRQIISFFSTWVAFTLEISWRSKYLCHDCGMPWCDFKNFFFELSHRMKVHCSYFFLLRQKIITFVFCGKEQWAELFWMDVMTFVFHFVGVDLFYSIDNPKMRDLDHFIFQVQIQSVDDLWSVLLWSQVRPILRSKITVYIELQWWEPLSTLRAA